MCTSYFPSREAETYPRETTACCHILHVKAMALKVTARAHTIQSCHISQERRNFPPRTASNRTYFTVIFLQMLFFHQFRPHDENPEIDIQTDSCKKPRSMSTAAMRNLAHNETPREELYRNYRATGILAKRRPMLVHNCSSRCYVGPRSPPFLRLS